MKVTLAHALFPSMVALAACGQARASTEADVASAPSQATAQTLEPPVAYDFVALDGRSISTSSMHGRFTVIAFLASYDVASQAEARFLSSVEHLHAPRANVAALFLEAPENRPLVDAFAKTLGLTYPIAMADADTIAGKGPFTGLHHVPSVVVLDPDGRVVYHHVGVLDDRAIGKALTEVEKLRADAR